MLQAHTHALFFLVYFYFFFEVPWLAVHMDKLLIGSLIYIGEGLLMEDFLLGDWLLVGFFSGEANMSVSLDLLCETISFSRK